MLHLINLGEPDFVLGGSVSVSAFVKGLSYMLLGRKCKGKEDLECERTLMLGSTLPPVIAVCSASVSGAPGALQLADEVVRL